MSKKNDTAIRRGTGNIFADLNFPDADSPAMYQRLVRKCVSSLKLCRPRCGDVITHAAPKRDSALREFPLMKGRDRIFPPAHRI